MCDFEETTFRFIVSSIAKITLKIQILLIQVYLLRIYGFCKFVIIDVTGTSEAFQSWRGTVSKRHFVSEKRHFKKFHKKKPLRKGHFPDGCGGA